MWLCDQSLVTLAIPWLKLSKPQFYKDLARKNTFFEGWSWFKFKSFGILLGMALKFYTRVAKRLKLKVRKLWGLLPRFVEITVKKRDGGSFCLPPPSWIGLNNFSILQIILANQVVRFFNQEYHQKESKNFFYSGYGDRNLREDEIGIILKQSRPRPN